MDSRAISALGRLDIIETGRRRRWLEDEKLRIVLESLAGPRLVSATARRHGISRSLLLSWRRAFRAERSEAGSASGFVPAVVVPEPTPSSPKPDPRAAKSREGPPSYEEFLAAFADPDHERHAKMVGWHGEPFDPAAVDLVELDRALQDTARSWNRTRKAKPT